MHFGNRTRENNSIYLLHIKYGSLSHHTREYLSCHTANTNDYTHMPNTFNNVVKCMSNQCKPGYLIAVEPQVKRQQLLRFR